LFPARQFIKPDIPAEKYTLQEIIIIWRTMGLENVVLQVLTTELQ